MPSVDLAGHLLAVKPLDKLVAQVVAFVNSSSAFGIVSCGGVAMFNWTSSAGLRPNAASNGVTPPYVTERFLAGCGCLHKFLVGYGSERLMLHLS